MNALIIVANPNSRSFSHRLANIAVETFQSQGNSARIIDLYEEEIARSNDVIDFHHEFERQNFSYKLNQKYARENGTYIKQIQSAQQAIMDSELIIFQFPLWWFSMPAIMRNWIEKVFSFDFAYNGREKRFFSNGPFKGKRAMLSITTSGSERLYMDQGINGDIMRVLWPIHNGILNFTGFTVLPPFISWGSDTSARDSRGVYEAAFKERIANANSLIPLTFRSLNDFGDDYVLKSKDCNVY